MDLADFAAGVAWACALLLALSSTHKLAVLLRGAAATEPLLVSHGWTGRASTLLSFVVAAEVATLLLLLLEHTAGLAASAVLIGGYAVLTRGMDADTPCHCFSGSSATRARSAVVRNTALAGVCAAAAIGSTIVDQTFQTPAAVGMSVVVLAMVGAFEALDRFAANIRTGVLHE